MVWCGMVWYGMVWCGMVWYGMVWCCMVWYGVVWCGMLWCSIVWCGMVWYGMALHGIVYMVLYGLHGCLHRCVLVFTTGDQVHVAMEVMDTLGSKYGTWAGGCQCSEATRTQNVNFRCQKLQETYYVSA